VLRIGADNILQTRDEGYGSRNLVDLNLGEDVNFARTAAEPDFTDVHSELTLTPAHWIEVDMAQVFSPRTFRQREFDATLILRNADLWQLHLATDILRHQDNAYLVEYSQRLNEQYTLEVLMEYDARSHLFPERAIGIRQNLVNTWRLLYLLTYYSGPTRSGHLGLQVEADVIRF
jgi:hypothetical protein